MKKRIITIAISTIITGTVITSCQSSAKKVEDAKENVIEAKQELSQVLKDSIQQFKTESSGKIASHEKIIADFRTRISKEKKATNVEYLKKLTELEQKNSDLKKSLDDFKEESQDKWYTFKVKFTNDMDDLGRAFKELTSSNKKSNK